MVSTTVFHVHWVCYLAIACLSLLLVTSILRRHHAQRAVTTAIRLASMSAGIPTYCSSLPRLRQEIDRARRCLHPLTLIVLGLQIDTVREREAGRARLFAFTLVGSILRDGLRAMDFLAFDANHGEYVLLLPESPKPKSLRVIQRLEELTWAGASVRLQAGIAEFPGDGLTIEALVEACRAATSRQLPAHVLLGRQAPPPALGVRSSRPETGSQYMKVR